MKKEESLKTFQADELIMFCHQMELMIRSGIPFYEGMDVLYDGLDEGMRKQALKEIDDRVQQYQPLGQAVKETQLFPQYFVKMVELGEEAGRLEDVFRELATYYEKEAMMKRQIRQTIINPAILFVMMSAVILLLVVKVLPMFNKIFIDLGGEMSPVAMGLMNIGQAIGNSAIVIVLGIILLGAGLYAGQKTVAGKKKIRKGLERIPAAQQMIIKTMGSKFMNVMALTLNSGMNMEDGLIIARDIVDDEEVAEKIDRCNEEILLGKQPIEAMDELNIFSKMDIKMLQVGFKAGAMDEVFQKLAHHYEQDVDQQFYRFTAILEPTLVGILSLAIGVILISVMLPLMGIMSAIG